MTCATKSVKIILHLFNALMILVGVLVIYTITDYINDLPHAYSGYMYFIGAINLLYGLLGFLGICRENVCTMKVYANIILVSIIAQVIAICFAYKFDDLIREKARDNVRTQWQKEIEHPGAMDALQIKYMCCGNNAPNDYINVLHRPEIPKSCYSNSNSTDTTKLYKDGCLIGVENGIVKAFSASSKGEWANILLTVILFGFALYLTMHFMNKKRRSNYKR